MKRYLAPVFWFPLIAAGQSSDEQAVRLVVDKIIAGEGLPEEIMGRQSSDFPDLDKAILSARGCRTEFFEKLQNGNYGVTWRCKGRKKKDMPSAMMIDVKGGQVTRVTTAFMNPGY